ncbi:FTR1 family protein [Schaalia sp. 19OD2882]|uniref:FTR1 family iron permease n=1 Tax=Schaalia sp. 19OD2882 TaxID=2794089 RepID=UPI0020A78CA4|nr:FTR1 family protein [Schaalia sp. 19OD2882]
MVSTRPRWGSVWILTAVATVLLLLLPASPAKADHGTWTDVAEEMAQILDDAHATYLKGDVQGGKDGVNTAYYRRYETLGFEKQVMARISGERVSAVEMEFSLVKKAMSDHDDAAVAQHLEILKKQLIEDAALLDGVSATGSADDYSPGAWGQVAKEMAQILDDAHATYLKGDVQGGKDGVNTAYYRRYETLGFEKQVMARVSGERVSAVEMEFSLVKKAMSDHDDAAVEAHLQTLKNFLREDANALDGYTGSASRTANPWLSGFLPSLLVILREGMEAILVVAAILAYLTKAGHRNKARVVWLGVGLALVFSVILAILFSSFAGLAGANQEILEGVAALFAVAMLIWVSNWMVSKSSNEAWDRYIKDKTDASLTRGSLLGLAAIAFLAVLREGAETILFYVPIVSQADEAIGHVWIGVAVGAVALVIVFLLIRFAALRIPLRPFFAVTSLLLALMAVTFTGSGIKELQEADVLPLTYVDGFPTIDLLGIYPRVENLCGQALVLATIVGLYFWGKWRQRHASALQAHSDAQTHEHTDMENDS